MTEIEKTLKSFAEQAAKKFAEFVSAIDTLMDEAIKQPQIVHCKDCKHYRDNRCLMENGTSGGWWYCADGLRRG